MFFVNHNLFRPTTMPKHLSTRKMHPQEDDDFCRFESHQDLEGHQLSWFFPNPRFLCVCVCDGFLVALSAVWLGGTDTGSNLSLGWFKVRLISLYVYGNQKGTPRIVRQKHWTCRTITSYFQRNHVFDWFPKIDTFPSWCWKVCSVIFLWQLIHLASKADQIVGWTTLQLRWLRSITSPC